MALTVETAPRVHAWVSLMEDLSGLEPSEDGWIDIAAPPPTLLAVLAEIGRVYPPVMLANARAIGAAAEHGDLSENSEWKFALEERDMLRARAAKMQDELSRTRVLKREDVPSDTVGIGSRVHLRRLSDRQELALTFLGPWDIDAQKSVYNYQTRMAQDLMGKSVGATVEIRMEGFEGFYTVERLESAIQ